MERNINSLINYNITATDGMIGEVEEFYFDDQSYKIRYMIVKTGNWLSERKVLIPPGAILKQPWKNGLFPVNLTQDQVKNSPDIDTDKPVSRQQEIELYGHYQWESYWGSGFYGGGSLGVSMPFPVVDRKVLIEADKKDNHADDDIHLRSTGTITGYHIHAIDGEIGHVKDFIINDGTWQLMFIVVDTTNWFGGKKVVIPISHIKKIEWTDNLVFLNISKAAVDHSQLFEEEAYLHLQLLK
jgi:sporulation protein YlmC with PRC-barrel domain